MAVKCSVVFIVAQVDGLEIVDERTFVAEKIIDLLKCSCVVCNPISLVMRFRSLSESYSETRDIKGWNLLQLVLSRLQGKTW